MNKLRHLPQEKLRNDGIFTVPLAPTLALRAGSARRIQPLWLTVTDGVNKGASLDERPVNKIKTDYLLI